MHIQELKYITHLKMYNRQERKYNTNGILTTICYMYIAHLFDK